jgi:ribosomal protein S18 acetylase RimI-like enzyme
MIQIRTAQHEDLGRLKEIRHAAYSVHAPSVYSPQEVENLLGDLDEDELVRMIDAEQLFVAVVEDGSVCGLAGWHESKVRHVYVDPAMTRRGTASRLLAHAEHDFRTRTREDEIHVGAVLYAEPFYAANGYRVVSRSRAWDNSEYYEMATLLVDGEPEPAGML